MAGKKYKFEAASVWLDGTTLAGKVNEIELPEISWEASEHETISSIGVQEFASKLESLECTITWAGYSPELAAAAANPYNAVNLQVRANIGEYVAAGKTGDKLLRIDLTGRFLQNQLGSFSPGEMERETMMKVDYVAERWDGNEVMAIGISPPILRVNGDDLLADMRRNLGLN